MDTVSRTVPYADPDAQNGAAPPRPQDATLVILYMDQNQGNHCQVVELNAQKREWIIGRSGNDPNHPTPNLDIDIQSRVFSRGIHGRFRRQNGAWCYYDEAHVKNSTYYNGVKLSPGIGGEKTLSNWDILRIDVPTNPHPEGVWILFSTVSILGKWQEADLSRLSEGEKLWIGRDAACQICEPLHYISAKHAFIQRKNGQLFLSDNRSKNGTYRNGAEVTAPVALREKDWFSICDCHFILLNNHLFYNYRQTNDRPSSAGRLLLTADILSKTVPDKTVPGGRKELLHNIHLEIQQGSLVALLGGSGAGKSTLMNCLNGFDSSGVEGCVIYKGENLYQTFNRQKREMGSVPQKNTFRETQTVEAELRYDALLRLPGDTSREDIEKKVDETIRTLGLEKQRGTPLRKLSGGEQKRVSIGVELVADRSFLCLDEPDAGLDPLTKRELFKTLQKLAHEDGKTILVIIHDVAEIDLFDQVIMLLREESRGTAKPLYRGRLAFSGTPKDALAYFQAKNAVDPVFRLKDVTQMTDAYELVAKNPNHYIWPSQPRPHMRPQPAPAQGRKQREKALSLPKEFFMSIRQFWGLLWSDKTPLLISLLFPMVAALITVFVAGEKMFLDYEGTKSACLLLVSAAIWVGLFNSIQIVVRERDVIKLEYIAGRRLGCCVLSKGIVQMALCLVESALLLIVFPIVRWRFDRPDDPMQMMPNDGILFGSTLFEYYISLFLLMYAADAMGLCISCLVKKAETANMLSPYILILQLVFSGVLFTLKGAADALSNALLSKWGMAALGTTSNVNARLSRIFIDNPNLLDNPNFPLKPRSPEDIFSYEAAHLLHIWLILLLFSAAFLLIGSLVLRRVAKDTR